MPVEPDVMTEQPKNLPEQFTLEDLARLQFSPEDIAIFMEWNKTGYENFILQLQNKEGDLYKQYQKGRLIGEYHARNASMVMAVQGSTPAQTIVHKMIEDNKKHCEDLGI